MACSGSLDMGAWEKTVHVAMRWRNGRDEGISDPFVDVRYP